MSPYPIQILDKMQAQIFCMTGSTIPYPDVKKLSSYGCIPGTNHCARVFTSLWVKNKVVTRRQ